MIDTREERMEECLKSIKKQLLLTLFQEQRTAANALGKATRRQASHTCDLLQNQINEIDEALASDTAIIEISQ